MRNQSIAMLALLLWITGAYGEDMAPSVSELQVGTRNLIYTPDGAPTQNLAVGLEVELLAGNPGIPGPRPWVRVPDTRVFVSGEKIRFAFTSTQDAFAYLLCRNSDGTKAMLWPSFQAGANSFVQAGRRITIPTSGSPEAGWVFTGPPGMEELILVLSRERIPKLDAMVGMVQGRSAQSGAITEDEFKQAASAIGEISSRNLIYVPEGGPQQPPFVCNPVPAEPLKVRLLLRHGAPSAFPAQP